MKWTIALVLLGTLFASAGCFDEEASIRIGQPSPGDRFVYEGTDGTQITVTIGGQAVRSDGAHALREVLLIEYNIRPANFPHLDMVVEEAVDLRTGLHVRHDELCNQEGGSPEELRCEGSLHQIFFISNGIPGALGLAPFWGKELREGRMRIPFDSPLFGGDIEAEAVSVLSEGRRCLDIRPLQSEMHYLGPWMPITSSFAPRLVCPGDVFPTEWTPDRGMPVTSSDVEKPTFKQIGDPGKGHVARSADSQDPPMPPKSKASGPLMLLTEAKPISGFDAAKAHEMLLAEDEDYARFFKDGDPTMVVDARFTSGGGYVAPLGTTREEHSSWTIQLARRDGSAFEATVRQTERSEAFGGESTSYSVTESGPAGRLGAVPPDPANLTGHDSRLAYDYGNLLIGAAPDGAYHLFTTRTRIGGEHFPLNDRSITRTFTVPPEDKEACSGTCIVRPWIVETDSKSGWVTYVRLPADLRLAA